MINQTIYIRHNNQVAKATIVKQNRVKARVRLEENFQRWNKGQVIVCPFELMFDANGNRLFTHGWNTYTGPTPAQQVSQLLNTPKPPFQPDEKWVKHNFALLEILGDIYAGLSPENLSGDGEASRAWVRKQEARLMQKMRACFILLEQEISEEELYTMHNTFKNLFYP